MGLALLIGGIGLILFLVMKGAGSEHPIPPEPFHAAQPERTLKIPEWLYERWKLAAEQSGSPGGMFPPWYFDPMTDRQAARLDEQGQIYLRSMTKGQASDLIGLDEPPSAEDLEILRFFKRPLRNMSQTRARHEVALLFREEANRAAWEKRPMTAVQKEFFRFFGRRPAPDLSKREADRQMAECLAESSANGDPRVEHWEIFKHLIAELTDPDALEDYELRKPSIPQIRKAVDSLLSDGKSWADLDADMVADRLLELHPNLNRS